MNESQVFTHALRLAGPAERAAYLDQACAGDPQLRADVEALLRAHVRDPGFLERPAGLLRGTTPGDAEPPATQCGAEQPGTLLAGRSSSR